MKLRLYHEHSWTLTPGQARRLQESLRAQVCHQPLDPATVHRVGGVDASFSGERVYAAAVSLDYPSLEPLEQAVAELPLAFPYIPGLLSFREAPAILSALAQLSVLPDVLIVDGHGWAHPRRFGLACHLGVLLDMPTIGCAKSILIGQAGALSETAGSTAEILDGSQVIGLALRTRPAVRPVYVSVGHRVDLSSAARIVMDCGRGFRLPEPTRQAHRLASSVQRS